VNNLVGIDENESKLILLGDVLYIFESNKVKVYNLSSNSLIREQNISKPKEWVNGNDGVVYYGEDNNVYKIEAS
jgi:hypothetical protein